MLHGQKRGLRIQLHIDPDDPGLVSLASLPWELLYRKEMRDFLSLPHSAPVVRYLEDWAVLFKVLEEGRIKPVIMKKFPILEAAKANGLLESGQVIGNVVLVAPELL